MAKITTVYRCSECDYESLRWLGRCPMCKEYNTFVENVPEEKIAVTQRTTTAAGVLSAVRLHEIKPLSEGRVPTNIEELDRVLSGGIVQGSLTLVGGEPGIGKSTLLLQLCQSMEYKDRTILYVSGEESLSQIKLRAERLGITTDNLYLLAETNLETIELHADRLKPALAIIDSVQTMHTESVTSAPGSVTQVRECTARLMRIAKGNGVSIIIVGHVTKEGALAGPRVLEHMVDTVLYFEGERQASYRIIRAVKNRFGTTNEIGVFEMKDNGLNGIANPSEYMLSGRPLNAPGSVVTCSMEGTRPILAEVQALVCQTNFNMPRRVATGMDYNRVVMLIAMLEKRAGLMLGTYDSYINIAGGMKLNEPAVDMAAVAAVASSYRNKPVPPHMLVFGEAGLTGEARAVPMAEKRMQEAAKLGFTECAMPQANIKGLKTPKNMRLYGVSNVGELLQLLFS